MTFEAAIDYSLRVLLIIVMGVLAYRAEAVDKKGLLSGYLVGSAILLVGGWGMFALIAYFFVIASLATKYRYEYKRSKGVAEEKRGARSAGNVLGNGIVATVFALGEFLFKGEIWALGYIGAVAMVTSDTLATEIGLLYWNPPRLITDLRKKVEPGQSGGVTPLGYLTIILSSLSVGALAWMFNVVPGATLCKILSVALTSGLIGSTVDSILGATVQAQYRCRVCGKLTEKSIHCGEKTVYVKGCKVINNHVVNLTGSLIGALTAILVGIYIIT